MKNKLLAFSIIVALLMSILLIAAPIPTGHSSPADGDIKIIVQDQDGNPIPNADVRIGFYSAENGFNWWPTIESTNANGSYTWNASDITAQLDDWGYATNTTVYVQPSSRHLTSETFGTVYTWHKDTELPCIPYNTPDGTWQLNPPMNFTYKMISMSLQPPIAEWNDAAGTVKVTYTLAETLTLSPTTKKMKFYRTQHPGETPHSLAMWMWNGTSWMILQYLGEANATLSDRSFYATIPQTMFTNPPSGVDPALAGDEVTVACAFIFDPAVSFEPGVLPAADEYTTLTYAVWEYTKIWRTTISASPLNILADGTSNSTITATINDVTGTPIADGKSIVFTTTRGTIISPATTSDGNATTTLTSSTTPGIAHVRAAGGDVFVGLITQPIRTNMLIHGVLSERGIEETVNNTWTVTDRHYQDLQSFTSTHPEIAANWTLYRATHSKDTYSNKYADPTVMFSAITMDGTTYTGSFNNTVSFSINATTGSGTATGSGLFKTAEGNITVSQTFTITGWRHSSGTLRIDSVTGIFEPLIGYVLTYASYSWNTQHSQEHPNLMGYDFVELTVKAHSVYSGENIQTAVDIASSGDRIVVYPGVYGESVIVTKSLTMEASVRATTPGAANNTIIDPPDGYNCLTVNADGVIIDGFELNGTKGGDGIAFESSNSVFEYNLIHNIDTGETGGGIVCWDYDGNSDNNTISYNTIFNVTADGILYGACTLSAINEGSTISNNVIYNCGTYAGGSWTPSLEVVNGKNFTVFGNNVSGNPSQYYGILIYAWNTMVQGAHTVSRNTVTGHYTGIAVIADTNGGTYQGLGSVPEVTIVNMKIDGNEVSGVNYHGIDLRAIPNDGTASVTNCVVSNNEVHDNGINGIYLRTYVDGNLVSKNRAHNNLGTGIRIFGNENEILENTINDNEHGLWIDGDNNQVIRNTITNNTSSEASGIHVTADAEGTEIHWNNMTGNSPYGVFNEGPIAVSAIYNWWGNAKGPYHPETNPDGLGDAVSNYVIYKPWLIEPYPPTTVAPQLHVDPPIIECRTPAYGETFTINVSLSDVNDFYSFEFKLYWNITLLECVESTILPPWVTYYIGRDQINNTVGMYWGAATGLGNATSFNGNTTIVTLTFQIKYDPIYPQNVSCFFDLRSTMVLDSEANFISHTVNNGEYLLYSTIAKLKVQPSFYRGKRLGDTFNVNITVVDIVNLYTFDFEIMYNTTLLKVTEVTIGPFLNEPRSIVKLSIDNVAGVVKLRVMSLAPALPASGDGTIAIIAFKVMHAIPWQEDVVPLECALSFNFTQLVTDKGVTIPHLKTDGLYRFDPLPGDLNMDAVVGLDDLYIVSYAFGTTPGDPYWNPLADVDKNGIVNVRDLTLIAKNYGIEDC